MVQEQIKSKQVNGVDLVWSPEHEMYMLPMPEKSKFMFLFDEEHGALLPVINPNNMVFREREATAPDGTHLRERVVYRQAETITDFDLQNHRNLVTAKRLQWMAESWDTLVKFRPVFVLGVFATMIAFFYNVILALNGTAAMVGAATGTALAELSYYAVWGAGIFLTVVFLRYAVPAVINRSAASFSVGYEAENMATPNGAQVGDVTINIQQGNGAFGSQSEAQKIINKREL